MKLYAKIVDNEIVEWPVQSGKIMVLNPNTIFPGHIDSDASEEFIVNELGYTRVYDNEEVIISPSDYSKFYEYKIGNPVLADDGNWYYSIEQVQLDVESERYKARLNYQWGIIRDKRAKLLKETDARIFRYLREVSQGLELTEDIVALETYRQALCDITEQDDPFRIVWPYEGW